MSDKLNKIEDDIRALNDIEINEYEVQDITELINKAVTNRIKIICLKTIASVAIVVGIIFLLISPLMKATNVNVKEYSENMVGENLSKLDLLLKVRMNLLSPFSHLFHTEVEDLGFGNYEIKMILHNQLMFFYSNEYQVVANVNRGDFEVVSDMYREFILLCNRYGYEIEDDYYTPQMETLYELPNSANIAARVGFKDKLSLEQVFSLFNDDDRMLEYVNIYDSSEPYELFGFKVAGKYNHKINDNNINENYPNLLYQPTKGSYLSQIDEYKQHFISNLNYLNDSELQLYSDGGHWKNFVDIVNDPNFEFISSGIEITGSKEEMIEFLETNKELIDHLAFYDIRLY